MAGVVTPSMWMFVLEDPATGRRTYCSLNEGLGKVLGTAPTPPRCSTRLRWMGDVSARCSATPCARHRPGGRHRHPHADAPDGRRGPQPQPRRHVDAAARPGAGDGASGSTPPTCAEALRFVGGNDHFFLNLAMPACKLALDAGRDIPGSTMVVAMARNGTDFGIQVSGTGDEWFTGPAQLADGLYLGDYGPDDANPDIGDSAITETAGIGGFAMATAPAIVRFVGGTVPDALATTRRMREITLTANPRWSIPVLEFAGVPTGIDVTRVCRTGILPQINTGMAGKQAGVGQVGAGLVTPPAEIFPRPWPRSPSCASRLESADACGRSTWRQTRPVGRRTRARRGGAGRTPRWRSTLPEGRTGCPPRGRPAAPRPGGSRGSVPSARTTRHHGTGPPCAAITEPT